jgi:CubicO group peptidase (beta-lactamase class C family)
MMKSLRRLLFVLVIFLIASSAYSADLKAQLDEFRKFAVQQMKRDQIPGMTIGFLRWGNGEDQVWVEGFGYSDLENQVLTKSNSAFRLGSVSKPLTAAAVLLLADRGKIDLDAEVQKYVPYFPKKKWPVTVRELLGHLGGISHYKDYNVEGRIKEHKSTREAIAIFEQFDLVAEPGTKYSYSSYGYNLLGAVVEGASGISFGEFMKQNIWGPFGMNETQLDDPADLISNRARGYRLTNGQVKNSEFVDISSRLGAGGTRSTVPDLLKFAKGLTEGKVLSSNSLSLMYSSMTTRDGHFTDYSAGWDTDPANGHYMLRHTGSQQETSTVLFFFPALKFAIACAINQEDAGASIFSQRLFELLTNERWRLKAYVTTNINTYKAIDSIFNSGLSYFELHGQPMTIDSRELKKAFDYFQSSVSVSKAADKMISDGPHPISGQPYTILGSYIAKILSEKSDKGGLEPYHANGSIPFFEDYLKQCQKIRKKNPYCAFPNSFQQLLSQWDQSWARTNSGDLRWLQINSESTLDQIASLMQKSFHSETAYPDFSRQIGNLTWDSLLKGENEKSLRAGELGASLYPESSFHLAMFGISLVAAGDKDRGISYLKKAYQLDHNGPAEPDWLPDFADELANAGKVQEAIKIMKAALEVHPNNEKLIEREKQMEKKL